MLGCALGLRCAFTRESLAFDDRGDALAPPLVRSRSRSRWSVAEADLPVVVIPVGGATAPGGNSSAESVAASSSFATITAEPFAIVAEPVVGSADLG